ncbi:MAG TPA: hypothetical protein VKA46_21340, partial [Gemmataceae bacterium]|nr:hypothetical protein [Gemmataceae bacterium]
MGWPTRSDYINALQRLPAVFRDAAFQAGAVPADARDRLGRPSPASGSFAVVFKLRVAGADTALRGYISPRHARRAERHYGVLRDYLKQRRPSCLVPFEYRPSFIQVVDEWYPVLTMEWVQGQNLWDWAAEQVANRSAGALREAADRWIELVGELKRYQIAHGDLQHGNVLVVNGALKLVDYDGMFVPAFQGDEAGAVEDGVPAYQHPRRPEQTTRSPALDDFSAWVILIALRALASDPGLWGRYVEETDNENLLFSPEDIQEPDRPGNLWESLRQSGDPQVVEWSRRLRESLDRPFAEIPPFEVDPFRPLREARDPDEIVRLASELALAGRDLPDDLARKLTAAREQCAARDEVAGALAAGNVRRAVAYLDEQLLAYWPKLLERGRLARQQVAWLDEIQKLVRETRDGRDLLRGWLRLRLSLAGIPEAERLGKVAESWRRRLECLEALQAELAKSPPSEAAVARAWKELCGAGNHPEAAGLKDRAELAGKYALKVPTVRDLAAKPPGEQVDRALCGAWDEGGLEGCDEVIPLRPAVEKARGRVRLLDRLGTLVKGDGTDEQIRAIVDALPPDYPYELKGSLEEIRKQEVARKKLREALGRVPLSHVKLAEAWEACCDAGV